MARSLNPGGAEAAARIGALLDAEMRRPVAAAVTQLAQRLAARAGAGTAAVLFYGSALGDGALEGVLDFYVLLERERDWPGSRLAALALRLLPPNVGYAEEALDGRILRAKYAVMTLAQFRRAMSARALDTTLWARFSQPCACVLARSDADRQQVLEAVSAATITAARWAAALGPESGEPLAYWRALYSRTYEAELRVERSARSDTVLARAPERYARLLPESWRASGLAFEMREDASLRPLLGSGERGAAARRWAWRQRLGRPLNVLRLLKAAFTFDRAMDYVAWKVERHSGVRLEIAPWQRRFPLLAAPGLYWQLRRRGLLR